VVLALFWWKRKPLLAVPKANWWPAFGLVLVALVLHLGGYLIQQTRVSVVAFFVGLYGLMGLVWGWRFLCAALFPFLLFAFCLPWTALADPLTMPLRLFSAWLASGAAQVLGVDMVRDGTQLFNASRTFAYDVAPACSGIRSLLSLFALTTTFGFVVFRSWWKRAALIALALPLALAGNALRLTLVMVTAEGFGQEAGAAVETNLGFITFVLAIACLLWLDWLWREPKEAQT
jgi:exosortase